MTATWRVTRCLIIKMFNYIFYNDPTQTILNFKVYFFYISKVNIVAISILFLRGSRREGPDVRQLSLMQTDQPGCSPEPPLPWYPYSAPLSLGPSLSKVLLLRVCACMCVWLYSHHHIIVDIPNRTYCTYWRMCKCCVTYLLILPRTNFAWFFGILNLIKDRSKWNHFRHLSMLKLSMQQSFAFTKIWRWFGRACMDNIQICRCE